MPYTLRKANRGVRKWKIINKDTGEVVGSSLSREKAMASIAYRSDAEKPKKIKKTIRRTSKNTRKA